MDGLTLSLIVVSFNMQRELPRTLRSLSSNYQRDFGANYEIIVVDNGSDILPELNAGSLRPAAIRLLESSANSPSPVHAINEGLQVARGGLCGVWIDGARLASPGLLKACLAASRLHPRAVVVTLNYQLGPARQLISGDKGYDQAAEDRLLGDAEWEKDGYRLFDIAVAELANPTAPMLETNALFMTKELWNEIGGYDPAFAEPGGGLVNPDTLIRAVALPGAQLIRILGEGTFHQFHNGLTTSSARQAMDILKRGSRDYLRLRGKRLAPVSEVGWLYDSRTGVLTR